MPVSAPAVIDCHPVHRIELSSMSLSDEVLPELGSAKRKLLQRIDRSVYWTSAIDIERALHRLRDTERLSVGWDTYDAEPPNHLARENARLALALLDKEFFAPRILSPSVEGGIAMSFVEGEKRAELEFYNTGETIAAMYARYGEPTVWQFDASEEALRDAIRQIRVYLAAQ